MERRVPHFFRKSGTLKAVVWKLPITSALIAILKNPAYAGAFVYGRTRTLRTGAGPRQVSLKRLPIAEWRIRLNANSIASTQTVASELLNSSSVGKQRSSISTILSS